MKRCLLLIPVAAAAYALWLCVRMRDLTMGLLVFGPVILGFALHALTRFLLPKDSPWADPAPLGLLVIPLGGMSYEAMEQSAFWLIGAFLWLVVALLYLLGWASAFGLEGKQDE